MLPTLRQLRYLTLLAEHRSFRAAAQAAHVSQPALSAGIAELEKILGAPVVDRARSGLVLTAVGQAAVERAGDILARTEDLVDAAQAAGRPLTGRFRLGVIPTIAPFMLPVALPRLKAAYPQLRLYLREDLTPRLVQGLKTGGLEAALIALPYDMAGLEWAHIADDELLAATPADHPLAAQSKVTPEALDGEAMILLEDGHCLREHALAACGLPDPGPGDDEGFAASSLPTLVEMVGSGLGVSFLPAMAVRSGLTRNSQVAVRPLAADHPSREIVIAWRKGSSRGAEARLLAEAFRP
ncbi:hydrogen peroxide-inducible genes activator [Brevundimonas sp.]|uniref:hydrogen peroxide-inducible genes activator n=1 Tax=Brevundimonas sp. TaxID=1871086 RepID=UPI0025FD591F|nr:hydrogen peroxide-inducible genes activator [Brevundimonas sp.]